MPRKIYLFIFAVLFVALGAVQASAFGATTSTTWKNLAPPRAIPWYQPLLALPHADLLRAQCVIRRESRSTFAHPNLGDDNGNPGQSGIFQMNNQPGGVWDIYAMPVLHVVIWRASAFQQAEGFMLVWRKDGFGPWHPYDGC